MGTKRVLLCVSAQGNSSLSWRAYALEGVHLATLYKARGAGAIWTRTRARLNKGTWPTWCLAIIAYDTHPSLKPMRTITVEGLDSKNLEWTICFTRNLFLTLFHIMVFLSSEYLHSSIHDTSGKAENAIKVLLLTLLLLIFFLRTPSMIVLGPSFHLWSSSRQYFIWDEVVADSNAWGIDEHDNTSSHGAQFVVSWTCVLHTYLGTSENKAQFLGFSAP